MLTIEDLKSDGWESGINQVVMADCLEAMKLIPDKSIDLILTDPPYGIGEDGGNKNRRRGYAAKVVHAKKTWDTKRLAEEFFTEMFRISKNQIIFGANYYSDFLPPSMGWIVWDKNIGGDFSDGELVFTSFKRALRIVQVSYTHELRGGHARVHPTQKPTEIIRWILTNHGADAQLICDPFMGSWTTARACKDLGRNFIGFELEEDYCKAGEERLRQENLF